MYIACTHPVYAPFVHLHAWVRRQLDWEYVELACGHDAMVICPEKLVELLATRAVSAPAPMRSGSPGSPSGSPF
jgi:hypothetical protein